MPEMKYIQKRIETQFTVKLMDGKTVRDMWTDFFKGQIPDGVIKILTNRFVGEFALSEKLYDFIHDNCKDEEFLKLLVLKERETLDASCILKEIYKKIPFDCKVIENHEVIHTGILEWTLSRSLDYQGSFTIVIETYTFSPVVSETDIKLWNKDHARVLRKYLVGLPSVQGVPYQCSYKDNIEVERSCEV